MNDGVPLYRRIAERIQNGVLRGDYAAGDRLPSVRELAIREGVNPNTIQNVYALLEREGWIDSRQGAGSFVKERGAASAVRRRENLRGNLERARREARFLGASEEEWADEEATARKRIPLGDAR